MGKPRPHHPDVRMVAQLRIPSLHSAPERVSGPDFNHTGGNKEQATIEEQRILGGGVRTALAQRPEHVAIQGPVHWHGLSSTRDKCASWLGSFICMVPG